MGMMELITAEQYWEVERCGITRSETRKKSKHNFKETGKMIVSWRGGQEVRAEDPKE